MSHVSHVPSVPGVLFVPLRRCPMGHLLGPSHGTPPTAGHLALEDCAPTSRPSPPTPRGHEHWRKDGTPAYVSREVDAAGSVFEQGDGFEIPKSLDRRGYQ